MAIADSLKRLREQCGVSSKEVAKFLGISTNLYERYESAEVVPDVSVIVNLANYFGVTTECLLGLEPPCPIEHAEDYRRWLIDAANRFYAQRVDEANREYARIINSVRSEINERRRKMAAEVQSLDNERKSVQDLIKFSEGVQLSVERFVSMKVKEFPEVATLLSELKTAKDEAAAECLEAKSRPAPKAAECVRQLKSEMQELIKQNKALEWEMKYLRRLLPWIEEIEDSTVEPVTRETFYTNPYYNAEDKQGKDVDNAGYWLSPEEYATLSPVERNQLALDRYKKRHKTNKEIGEAYERYIGYLFEQKGCKVEYSGIKNGLNDLGRDVICIKGNEIYVVQCKCWSNAQGKVIHEKHINQLYGTTVMYMMEKKRKNRQMVLGWSENLFDIKVIPIFFSTVPFSSVAKKFAATIGVELRQEPFKDYPLIKCNINAGKKIYHLPFDQQYDKTVISKRGEFYAMTVAEAEKAGFRRAKRWYG